ncbi:MAG TPA: EutN/CcmL family microcompartment protein [Atribacteraceae bacterium]|nr:EutN/CcmL family microcompartment protein [Atribacteraceae bacterium]
MIVGRVIGNVVATQKLAVLRGLKLMIVQPLDKDARPQGKSLLAFDTVQAGEGDTVLVLDEGNSSRMILADPAAPVRTMIVGIVDEIQVDDKEESVR